MKALLIDWLSGEVLRCLFTSHANNIQVQGVLIGVPTQPSANVGALTTANNQVGASARPTLPVQNNSNGQPSIIIVEVVGFGGGSGDGTPPQQPQDENREKTDKRRSQIDGGYDPYSPIHLLGNGQLTERQKSKLSEDEKKSLESLVGQSGPLWGLIASELMRFSTFRCGPTFGAARFWCLVIGSNSLS
jgi:hypothetical protein